MNTFKTEKGTMLPLLNLQGKDYLAVAHRIQWFREEQPTWGIETELRLEGTACLATAVIKDETGRIRAMAHKREDRQGFQDYIEKAETGAIGRALALVGYGTQFTSDLEEGSRLADAPAPRVVAMSQAAQIKQPTSGITNNGLYRISFGKYRNKTFADIQRDELRNYLAYLETAATPEKPLSPAAKEFIAAADAYLRTPNAFQTPAIQSDADQDIPAFHAEDIPF